MSATTLTFSESCLPAAGERFFLAEGGAVLPVGFARVERLPRLRTGELLRTGDLLRTGEFSGTEKLLGAGDFSARALSLSWMPGAVGSRAVWLMEALSDAAAGAYPVTVAREGWSLGWITLSDKGAAGEREDESGPLVATMVREKLKVSATRGFVLPDDEHRLRGLLADLALQQGVDLIITTGGTGLSPRDVTPEATLAVIEKRLAGFERAMTNASLAKTPYGAGSRAVAGTLGKSIIVNLPGSPKAVRETLEPLLPVLGHSLDKLHGDPSDCASLHRG